MVDEFVTPSAGSHSGEDPVRPPQAGIIDDGRQPSWRWNVRELIWRSTLAAKGIRPSSY